MYIPTRLYYNLATIDICTSNNINMYDNTFILFLSNIFQLKTQFPTRPIVLVGFSLAGRIATKVSVLQKNLYVLVAKNR